MFLSYYQATGTNTDYKRVYEAQQDNNSDYYLNNESTDNFRSVYNELVSKIEAFKHSDPNNERIPTDLKHCLNQHTIPLIEDILIFWEVNGNFLLHLKKNLEPYLCLVGTCSFREIIFKIKNYNVRKEEQT